jgi:hypothetical protein
VLRFAAPRLAGLGFAVAAQNARYGSLVCVRALLARLLLRFGQFLRCLCRCLFHGQVSLVRVPIIVWVHFRHDYHFFFHGTYGIVLLTFGFLLPAFGYASQHAPDFLVSVHGMLLPPNRRQT